jgi:hypothetical protein
MKPATAILALCIVLAGLLLSACPGKNMESRSSGSMPMRGSRY